MQLPSLPFWNLITRLSITPAAATTAGAVAAAAALILRIVSTTVVVDRIVVYRPHSLDWGMWIYGELMDEKNRNMVIVVR